MPERLKTFGAACLRTLVRAYLRYAPLSKGKARVWQAMRRLLKRNPALFGTSITTDRYGHRMAVDFREWNERNLYFLGEWNPDIEWLMARVLRPGDTFLDLGANIGYFTLLGARLVGPTGQVLSFEPSPINFQRLTGHVAMNGYATIRLYPKAVSNVAEASILFQPEGGGDLSSLRSSVATETSAPVLRHEIETVCLDQFLADDVKKVIRLVKIDIEGAEFLALQGMHDLLASPAGPDILCEINDAFLREMGSSETQILQYLQRLGYHAFLLGDRKLTPLDSSPRNGPFDAFFTRNPGSDVARAVH
jgi:FkbM family methyltransferase